MHKIVVLLLMVFALAACETTNTPQEPIKYTFDATKLETKEAIIKAFLVKNYEIVKDSDFQLVMDRPQTDNFGAQFLYGSDWNGTPNGRVTFTIVGDKPSIVNIKIQMVTNPGTAFERKTDFTDSESAREMIDFNMKQAAINLASTE